MAALRKATKKRLQEMIAEEQSVPIDDELLKWLEDFAQRDTIYWQIKDPGQRNAINRFFEQLEELMVAEVTTGQYGGKVILQTMLLTAFEVGYWTGNNNMLQETTVTID